MVIVVLSLGAGLSAHFIGGTAIARGIIRLPLPNVRPLQFAASGGVAVLIVVFIMGRLAYPDCSAKDSIPDLFSKLENDAIAPPIREAALYQLLNVQGQRDFRRRNLSSIHLPRNGWSGCDLSEARLRYCIMRGIDLKNTILVRTDLTGAIADSADFSGGKAGARMAGVILMGAQCRYANFRDAWIRASTCDDADFSHASFVNAVMGASSYRRTNFSFADLRGAELSDNWLETQAEGADFRASLLQGADLSRVAGWQSGSFRGAQVDEETHLPAGFQQALGELLDRR